MASDAVSGVDVAVPIDKPLHAGIVALRAQYAHKVVDYDVRALLRATFGPSEWAMKASRSLGISMGSVRWYCTLNYLPPKHARTIYNLRLSYQDTRGRRDKVRIARLAAKLEAKEQEARRIIADFVSLFDLEQERMRQARARGDYSQGRRGRKPKLAKP